MKKKKFDSELEIEELEDQLEEDLKRVEKEIKKLKPNKKTKTRDQN